MAKSGGAAAYTALVVGSTGAVGREVVAELVASANCGKVIALVRRLIPAEQYATSFPSMDAAAANGKLEVRTVDFDSLSETDIPHADKIDAAFCCLGTTRSDAGSAEAFRKVDLHLTTRIGELCKRANVPYFGLLTSGGASKNSWLLYLQTKAEAEANIQALAFPRTAIFRPGLLDRQELSRIFERIFLYVLPSATTRAVAKGMVVDYETSTSDKEWTNAEFKQFV